MVNPQDDANDPEAAQIKMIKNRFLEVGVLKPFSTTFLAVQNYWLGCAALFMIALVELSIAIAVLQLWLFLLQPYSQLSESLAKWYT